MFHTEVKTKGFTEHAKSQHSHTRARTALLFFNARLAGKEIGRITCAESLKSYE